MKKIVFVAALLLMLSLSACAHQDTKPNSTDSADDLQAESITMLDAGVWPVNEYTQGLPIPSGTVAWAMLDTEHGNCSISIADVTERDFADYRACLEQAGFFALEHAAEEIKKARVIFRSAPFVKRRQDIKSQLHTRSADDLHFL